MLEQLADRRAGRGYDVEQREKVGLQDFAVGQAGGQRPRRVLADRTARVTARYRLASLAGPAWLQAEKPGDLSPGELGVAHDECGMSAIHTASLPHASAGDTGSAPP